jgi:membrane protein DedA with SNARE-associated domain
VYTYLAIFGAVLSTIVLPLPEEVTLLGAGWAAHLGRIWLGGGLLAAWLAVLIGDIGTFFVGRGLLSRLLKGRRFERVLPRARRRWAERLVEEHGWRAIVLGRFAVGVRPALFLAVGASRYSPWRFVVIDGVVGLFEVGLLVGVGYLYGHFRRHTGTWIDLCAFLLLAIFLFGPLLVNRRFKRTRHASA